MDRCTACEAVALEQQHFGDDEENDRPHGAYWSVRKEGD